MLILDLPLPEYTVDIEVSLQDSSSLEAIKNYFKSITLPINISNAQTTVSNISITTGGLVIDLCIRDVGFCQYSMSPTFSTHHALESAKLNHLCSCWKTQQGWSCSTEQHICYLSLTTPLYIMLALGIALSAFLFLRKGQSWRKPEQKGFAPVWQSELLSRCRKLWQRLSDCLLPFSCICIDGCERLYSDPDSDRLRETELTWPLLTGQDIRQALLHELWLFNITSEQYRRAYTNTPSIYNSRGDLMLSYHWAIKQQKEEFNSS